jgi:hypothetical protein
MEITMWKTICFTVPSVALAVATASQIAVASPHLRARTGGFSATNQSVRTSSDYAALDDHSHRSAGTYGVADDGHFHYFTKSCWDLGTCD